MHLAIARQRKPQRLLGRGLADRAGDRDDLAAAARARRGGEVAQAIEHVGHDQQRRTGRHFTSLVARHNREPGTVLDRRLHEGMAVVRVALDGEEGLVGRDRAAVDRDAADRLRQRASAFRPHGGGQRLDRPQGSAHAVSSSAVATAS
jgi:hypothetical protein